MARYNTISTTSSVAGGSTISTPNSGLLTTLTGSGTVTIPNPVLYTGQTQSFYNSTGSAITLSATPAYINGPGIAATSTTVSLPAGSIITLISDGTNYETLGWVGGAVAITGGSINGATIGASTASSGAFTTLNASSTTSLASLSATSGTFSSTLGVTGAVTFTNGNAVTLGTAASGALQVTGGVGIGGGLTVAGASNINNSFAVGANGTQTNIAFEVTGQARIKANNSGIYGLYVSSFGSNLSPSADYGTQLYLGGDVGSTEKYWRFGTRYSNSTTNLVWDYSTTDQAYGTYPGSLAFSEKMRLSAAGNLGIGIANPVRTLTVSTPSGNTHILLQNSNYNGAINQGFDLVMSSDGSTQVWNYQNSYLAFGTNNNEAMRISSSGYLGIGTGSTVNNSLSVNGTIQSLGNNTEQYSAFFRALYNSTHSFQITAKVNSNTESELLSVYADSGGANARLILNTPGNGLSTIGIGTTSPNLNYLIHVVGKAGLNDPRSTAVNNTISTSASCVFVYNTAKDSDGGAWRKRTQNTSWYNETLNTPTRGSRQEFPSIAIIVATSSTVTIYDGDDPTQPLWMQFTFPTYGQFTGNLGDTPVGIGGTSGFFTADLRCVSMMNGRMFVGNGTASGSSVSIAWDVNFISEISYQYYEYPTPEQYSTRTRVAGTIVNRNSTALLKGNPPSRYGGDGIYGIYGPVGFVNMIVLPGARIDPLTRLPIPTIYVAPPPGSSTGVSMIRDDYTTKQFTYYYAAWSVKGLAVNKYTGTFITALTDGGANGNSVNGIEGADLYNTVSLAAPGTGGWPVFYPGGSGWTGIANQPALYWVGYNLNNWVTTVASMATASILPSNGTFDNGTFNQGSTVGNFYNNSSYTMNWAVGQLTGMTLISEHTQLRSASMVAFVSNYFNSGWLVGGIQGAWMSSVSTTSLTYSNMVANMTAANYTGYYATLSNPNGSTLLATITSTVAQAGAFYSFTCNANTTYYFAVTVICSAANMSTRIQISGIGLIHSTGVTNSTSSTTLYDSFFASSAGTYTIQILAYSPVLNATISMTNFVFTQADTDVSSARFGLVPSGTVARAVVNTTTDLVYYGPFSNGNYLYQPYIGNLDFGTGNFCYYGWVQHNWSQSSLAGCILQRGPTVNSNEFVVYIDTDGSVKFRVLTSANTLATAAGVWPSSYYQSNAWGFLAVLRNNGVTQIWVNGILQATGASTQTMTQAGYALNIGQWTTNNGYWINGGMALWRVTSTVPSPDQLMKIYQDELQLFQPNAKCTIYGSSTQVNAFFFDEDTQVLQVGTSAGTSQFQNLLRVGYTTQAVTTGISGTKGMVVSQ